MEEGRNKIMQILEDHEKRIKELEIIAKQGQMEPTKIEIGIKEGIRKLSKDASISEERLKHVFDFEEEDLTLITTIEVGSEAEKQFKVTVCILTAYKRCYGRDAIQSRNLRKKLDRLGIKSLSNLSPNLSKYHQFIVPKGESGSPNFSYKITFPGIEKGLEIIKELAGS